MSKIILIAIAGLVVGTLGGYGTGFLIYEPRIEELDVQVSSLSSEVNSLTSQVGNLERNITDKEAQIDDLESKKTSLLADLNIAQAQVQSQRAQIKSYKEQTSSLKSQLSDSQERLDKILDVTVTQNYQWDYQWETWQWDLPISLATYVDYLERPRPQSSSYWNEMAKDSDDDSYIDHMVQQINEAALESNFTEPQKMNFIIAFVQSLPYTSDTETTPYDEYPRYPVETLFDRGGDCEDTSILVASLLDRMGYDVALLVLKDAQHMAVGIALSGNYGTYYEYGGKQYFYLETTGEGWNIGEIPPSITETRANIYPLSN